MLEQLRPEPKDLGEAATRALKFESRKNNLPFMRILIG